MPSELTLAWTARFGGLTRRAANARSTAVSLVQAWFGERITLSGMVVRVPGSRRIRLSVVAGNRRIHRLIDAASRPGSVIVDVGAHTGYNTVYAAQRAGENGQVIAVEPTSDARAVLLDNISTNHLANVTVHDCAVGARRGERDFFVRGDTSAVNSLFQDSFYAPVTSIVRVAVMPLDDLVERTPDLVKIDVEGAELEVLAGMPRLLATAGVQLIVEWHPVLQEAAGYGPDALPRFLLQHGFTVTAAGHIRTERITSVSIDRVTKRLQRRRRPVELVARRSGSLRPV